MCSLVLHSELLINALSVVCFRLSNLYQSTISKYCPSEASYQLRQCLLHNQKLYLKHHFEVSWPIRCVWMSYWWGHWQACFYKVLLFIVDLKMSNGLMPAAGELMMLSRLLIMRYVDHAVQIIGVYLCLLVLRPRRSMVLQGSHIMNAPGILWSIPPVHISRETLKGSVFGVKPSIPALRGPRGGLVVAPSEKVSLLAISLTASSVVSSSSPLWLCLVSSF